MKQPVALHITIPRPCAQNWDAMQPSGEGKHCTQCNSVVYDFSELTDEETLHFFTRQPSVPCGRFHNSQLNRDIILPAIKKNFFITRFNKVAAAVFTLFSFKALMSQAAVKKVSPAIVLDAGYKNKEKSNPDKIIISGTVKDSEGKPIQQALVKLDTTIMATTDAEGKFSFLVNDIALTSHHLYFEYADLIPVVRNYHPVMLSTSYDVVLNKRGEGFHTMGIMLPPHWNGTIDLPSLVFKGKLSNLSSDHKAMLSTVATKLKEYPAANIIVKAYAGGHIPLSVFTGRIENIKKYLVFKEGISADRISITCENGGGDTTVVDILQDEN